MPLPSEDRTTSRVSGHLPESQGQNLVSIVLFLPYSLVSGEKQVVRDSGKHTSFEFRKIQFSGCRVQNLWFVVYGIGGTGSPPNIRVQVFGGAV